MELPGGLWEDGARIRSCAFGEISGALELAIADTAGGDRVDGATAALTAALGHLGGEPPTRDRVLDLCVDDRRWLMQRLAVELGIAAAWLTATCGGCGHPFDVRVELARLAVKPAGEGYPVATVKTSAGTVRVRVPTGRDQLAIAGLDDATALRALVRRCATPDPGVLADAELEQVGRAVEEVSPEVTLAVETECPACGHAARVPVDPYLCLGAGDDNLIDEVHQLASGYHWSESEILGLSRERRRRYLGLVRELAPGTMS